MKLITEYNHRNVKSNKDKDKKYVIEGIFIQCETKNYNGRIYPKKMMRNVVDKYIDEQIHANRAVGELNHPESYIINLSRVSHKITELAWDGNDVYGSALVLNTQTGQTLRELIDSDVQVGVSTRGVGTVTEKSSGDIINDDYVLWAIDVVQSPSAPGAYVNGILEGREYKYINGNLIEIPVGYGNRLAEAVNDSLSEKLNEKLLIKQLKEFSKMIESV